MPLCGITETSSDAESVEVVHLLKNWDLDNPHIQDIRGRGLMIGIDLDIPHKDIRQPLIYQEHCFTGCAGTNILRLLPPLCLSKAEADLFIEKLKKVLASL